jgi:hypothetical protein
MIKRWKIAFWILLVSCSLIIASLIYGVLDQGVSLTHMREGYTGTEADLQKLINITNSNQRSKDSIVHYLDIKNAESDTIDIYRCRLFFKSGQLDSVKQVW